MIIRTTLPDSFLTTELPALEEIFFSTIDQYPDMVPVLAKMKDGIGSIAQTTEQTGVGQVSQINEGQPIQYSEIAQGNSKTFTFLKYVSAVQISKEMIKDGKRDEIGDIYRSMGSAMHESKQTLFFNNFNNGFTTNGYDGVPLFSVNHPLAKIGGVENNTPSVQADLSVASLRTAFTDLSGTLSHEGFKTHMKPKYLLVSSTNVYDAHELLKSDLRPGTANNDDNAFKMYAGIEYIVSEYLSDSDAWFILCDPKSSYYNLRWYDRQTPETEHYYDFDTKSYKTSVESRWDTGHASWYGTYGNSGS